MRKNMNTALDTTTLTHDRVRPFPVLLSEEQPRPHTWNDWIMRRLWELGMVKSTNEPTKPAGFYFNYSTALFYLTVLGFIAGGFWFAYEKAEQAGYERGKQEKEMEQLRQELNSTKSTVNQQGEIIKMVVNPSEDKKK